MRFRNRLINPRRRRSKRWVGYRQPSPLLTQRWPWLENSAWSRTNTLQQPDLSRWVQLVVGQSAAHPGLMRAGQPES